MNKSNMDKHSKFQAAQEEIINHPSLKSRDDISYRIKPFMDGISVSLHFNEPSSQRTQAILRLVAGIIGKHDFSSVALGGSCECKCKSQMANVI